MPSEGGGQDEPRAPSYLEQHCISHHLGDARDERRGAAHTHDAAPALLRRPCRRLRRRVEPLLLYDEGCAGVGLAHDQLLATFHVLPAAYYHRSGARSSPTACYLLLTTCCLLPQEWGSHITNCLLLTTYYLLLTTTGVGLAHHQLHYDQCRGEHRLLPHGAARSSRRRACCPRPDLLDAPPLLPHGGGDALHAGANRPRSRLERLLLLTSCYAHYLLLQARTGLASLERLLEYLHLPQVPYTV